jgi:hypothetical protein
MKETLPENKTHTDVEQIIAHFDAELFNDDGWNMRMYQETKDWLRTTLQSQADKYEREKKEMVREMLLGINGVKNTSEGSQDWFNGIRATRSVVETIAPKYGVDLSE